MSSPGLSRTRLLWRKSRLSRKRRIAMAHFVSRHFACYDDGEALVLHEPPGSTKSAFIFLAHREFSDIKT